MSAVVSVRWRLSHRGRRLRPGHGRMPGPARRRCGYPHEQLHRRRLEQFDERLHGSFVGEFDERDGQWFVRRRERHERRERQHGIDEREYGHSDREHGIERHPWLDVEIQRLRLRFVRRQRRVARSVRARCRESTKAIGNRNSVVGRRRDGPSEVCSTRSPARGERDCAGLPYSKQDGVTGLNLRYPQGGIPASVRV